MSDELPGRRIGRYRVLELLGRGGMGVVYRAEDERTGAIVALKTVRAGREKHLAGLRREIAALSRIRHPGVVRIVAEGVDAGLPWYAMEMIRGTTLVRYVRSGATDSSPTLSLTSGELHAAAATEDVLSPAERARAPLIHDAHTPEQAAPERWWTHSLPSPLGSTAISPRLLTPPPASAPPPTRRASEAPPPPPERRREVSSSTVALVARLACRLCRALAFLHGEGIVHRDLKPENVIVRADGNPVLVDFGLMAEFVGRSSREALVDAPSAVGTVSYIAPEQLRGEFVDARADLYSLGCILYELIVGRPPFEGATLEAVARAHLSTPPLPPSALADGIPLSLERVILRLLAKEPAERLGYADDVAALLAPLAGEAGAEMSEPRPRPYLYRPRLAGRDDVMELLGTRVLRMKSGEGGVVLLGGTTGIGKTRLVMETARDAERAGTLLLAGAAAPRAADPDAPRGGDPLGALRRPLEMIADRCRAAGEPETRRLLGARARLLGAYEPSIDALPGVAELPPLARMPPDALRRAVIGAVTDVLLGLAAQAPVVLVLDDLEWADDLTLAWLAAAAHDPRLRAAKVLIVGSYRSDEASAALTELAETPGVESIAIGGLDEAAVGEMVRDMLALDTAPETFTRFLAQHSEGNPFFVAEYLHAAVSEGLLGRDAAGRWRLAAGDDVEQALALDALPLPRSLFELVRRRLAALGDDARFVAEIASAFGREADVRCLGDVSELDARRLLAAIDELVARQVMHDVSPGRIAFTHDKIRELAYETVPRDERATLHRAAARALERLEPAGMTQLATVARQHRLGGEPREAALWHLRSAEAAERAGALPEALEQYTAARSAANDLPEGAEERLVARIGRGGLLAASGHVDEAAADLEEALALAHAAGARDAEARIRIHLSYLGYLRGDPRDTLEQAERAATLAAGSEDLGLRARAESAQGIARGAGGEFARAIAHYERAAGLARRLGETTELGRHLGNIAINQRLLGRLDAARATAKEALATAIGVRERALECNALNTLARVEYERGELDAARSAFERALHLGGEIDVRHTLADAHQGLGAIALATGDAAGAREHAEIALGVAEELGYAVNVGAALRLLAEASDGPAPEAAAQALGLFERSVELLRSTAEKDELGESLLALGRHHAAHGDRDAARTALREASATFERLAMPLRLAAARATLAELGGAT